MTLSPCRGGPRTSALSCILSLFSLFAVVATLPAHAQTTLFWDGDGSGTVDGGTGTWNTTLARWSTTDTGTTYQVWDNAVSTDDAVFGGTAGTVTLGSNVKVSDLKFNTTGYTLSGSSTLTIDSGSGTIGNAQGTIDTGSGNQIIAVSFGADSPIIKLGSGTLSLSGTSTGLGTLDLGAGTLAVTSTGSLTTANVLYVARHDTEVAALTIAASGSVSTFASAIGFDAGSEGTVNVAGTLANSTALYIGYNGTGDLTVQSGGIATSATGELGTNASGIGTAEISGTWTNSGALSVGISGTGTLTVLADGAVSNTTAVLGTTPGSTGTANIAGTWTNSGQLTVGSSGDGHLTIQSTGEVTNVGETLIGFDADSVSTVTVAGIWTNDEPLYIGYYGTGTLTIEAGGIVSNTDGYLGRIAGSSSGTADISGTWTNSGSLYVGRLGDGDLTIQTGGVVTNANAYVGYGTSGTADVAGTWTNSGELLLGLGGTASLTIQSTGTVSNTNARIGFGSTTLTTVDVAGIWNNDGGLVIGQTTAGSLTIQDGGIVNVTSPTSIASSGGVVANLTIQGTTTAGVINTAFVFGGSGIATLDFAHSDTGYHFTTDGTSSGTAVAITGSIAVTHTGSGTTTLAGANTYTGGTTLADGTIALDSSGAIGTTGTIAFTGGTLQFSAANTTDYSSRFSTAASQAVSLDTNGQDLSVATALTSSGGSLTKSGTGTLSLSGANTYDGGTTVSGGTLTLDGSGTLGATSGEIAVNTGGTLNLNGTSSAVGNLTGTGGTIVNNASSTAITLTIGAGDANGGDYAGVIGDHSTGTGTLGLTKLGSGNLTLSGTNTYTGGTILNAGTLTLAHATDTLADSGTVTITNGTLALGANADTVAAVSLTSGSITGSGTLTGTSYALTGAGSVSTALAGNGFLTKAGAGTMTLSGANTYAGSGNFLAGPNIEIGTQISAGTLAMTATGSITHAGAATVVGLYDGDDGTLTIESGGSVSNAIGLIGGMAGSSGSVDVSGTWANSVFLGVGLTGDATLTVQSSGVVTSGSGSIGGDPGSSGTVEIAGTWTNTNDLDIGINGTANLTIQNGGTVNAQGTTRLSNAAEHAATLTLTGSSAPGILNTASIQGGNGTATIVFDHTNSAYHFTSDGSGSGDAVLITGSAIVDHTGTGTTTFSGANTYTGGTTVSAGTLILAGSGTLGSASGAVALNPGGTVDLNGTSQTMGNFTGTGGAVHNNASGTASTLTIGTGDATGGNFAGVIADHTTGTGTLALTKVGTGTLTLSGTNTYTGATNITAGQLVLDGSASGSAFTLSNSTLSGIGTLGDLTLDIAGMIAPGNSPGTLTVDGNAVWNGSGGYQWEVNNAAGIVSTNWDLLHITGSLTINATDAFPFSINLVSLTAANAAGVVPNFDANADASWTFVTTDNGITFGSGASIGASFALNTSGFQNPLNGTFGLSQLGDNLAITYTASAVPEPGTAAFLAGLLALGFSTTHHRRRSA